MARDTALRPRPAWLRALGSGEPPARLELGGRAYRLATVFKHDSWAATALYEAEAPAGDAADRIVVKRNREQPLGPLPMRWLGRRLARREAEVFERMGASRAPEPGVPRFLGAVGETGIAHAFVPGEPLAKRDPVDPDFLDRLEALVAAFHARGVALVDLQKTENVLRGADGRPWLLDFQIAWALPRRGLGRCAPLRRLHGLALRGDLYHLRKHRLRFLAPSLSPEQRERLGRRPWFIGLHRALVRPLHALRRRLLVALRVRDRTGKAASELHAEPGAVKRRRR